MRGLRLAGPWRRSGRLLPRGMPAALRSFAVPAAVSLAATSSAESLSDIQACARLQGAEVKRKYVPPCLCALCEDAGNDNKGRPDSTQLRPPSTPLLAFKEYQCMPRCVQSRLLLFVEMLLELATGSLWASMSAKDRPNPLHSF